MARRYRYETTCPVCGKKSSLDIDEMGFREYIMGRDIRDALPGLGEDDIELIVTGNCGNCRKVMVTNDLFQKSKREEDDDD